MNAIALNFAMPLILYLLGTVITALLGYGAKLAKDYIGITLQAKAQADLHSAILSGVKAALVDYAKDGKIDNPSAIYGPVLDYVKASVPDAIATLQPSEGILQKLIQSKLNDVLGSTTPTAA
ncbi:hypothetical protein KM176_16435 [Pseudooceanicola sp. CBS1P-1]|uniref:Phage holin n=1 Tax=Pseudooceanicola albus TaxID=2692189 RepID=A0A6L7G4S1_9RHOB|nr:MULTISPECIES: hypothetical protein [Pseudooceanicola]MBT9385463.1 hypothetical protein [Pseudooceanicola endophyticus]MXN19125.1 hypothetical protein [Pseudooceanicola albus]